MFGLLISGRPINAQPETISQTQYAFRIPSTPSFSHLALFLLPGSDFPSDVGASVWIQIPPSTEFKLLGALAATKQSAIYKINTSGIGAGGGAAATVRDEEGDVMVDDDAEEVDTQQNGGRDIVVGISIEPAQQVEAQLATLNSSTSTPMGGVNGYATTGVMVRSGPTTTPATAGGTTSPVSTKILAQRIIGNAFNFLASFGSETIPLKAFQDWWNKFEKKIELDPTFLERGQG